jgi:hypothetical protein
VEGQALWFYLLKEAELLGGKKLGPVGGRIVAEVILGLLGLGQTSYFNANPSFTPGSAGYTIGDLILAADAIDPRAVAKPEDPNAPRGAGRPGGTRGTGPRGTRGPPARPLPPDEAINPAAVSAVDSASLTAPV